MHPQVLLLASTDPSAAKQLRGWEGTAVVSVGDPHLLHHTLASRRRHGETGPRLHDPGHRFAHVHASPFSVDPLALLPPELVTPWAEAWRLALWMAGGLPGMGVEHVERLRRSAHLLAPLLLAAHATQADVGVMEGWLSELRDYANRHGTLPMQERNAETNFTATLSLLSVTDPVTREAAAAAAAVLRCPADEPAEVLRDVRCVLAAFPSLDGLVIDRRVAQSLYGHRATLYVARPRFRPESSNPLLLLISELFVEMSREPLAPPLALVLEPYLLTRLSMGLGLTPPRFAASGWL